MTDDAELLRRYAEEKSEDAFAELVRRHLDLVYAVALRKVGGDAHLAVDVAEKVFIDLAAKAGGLRRHPTLTGWLFTSTHYAATQLVRAERRRRAREQKAQTMNELLHESGPAIDWDLLRPVLDDLMLELDEGDREPLLLRFFEGRSWVEVGVRIQLTEEGARSRVDRALDKLRVALIRRGVASTSAALSVALASQAGAAAPAGLAASVTNAALAVTSMSATTGAGILAFMSTTKITLGAAGLLAAMAIGFGLREHGHARNAQALLAQVSHERDYLKGRVLAVENSAKIGGTAMAVSRPEVKRAAVATPAEALSASGGQGDANEALEAALDKLVAKSPELQRLYVRQQAVRLRSNYGPFYRAAGLTPAQIESFEGIMGNYAQASVDVPAVALAQGLKKNGPEAATLLRQAADEKAYALQEALGKEVYAELQRYERTRPLRTLAHNLAAELYYTDTPLTARQADQLTQIADASRGEQRGPVNWEFVVTQAEGQAVLFPPQLAVLREKKEEFDLAKQVYELTEPSRSKVR